ncbi:MAG: UDP-N-acetylmuramoyl-L-alanine--D-glutamate ligase [Pseudomonadota bacterium]|nr:UDP-N-acetylmuramoyl-L-alanine--D-glutamate ligase [Pseudomonadota bacterium]
MLWTNLENKTIGIWGMGREGLSVKTALLKHVPHAKIVEIGEDTTDKISGCDILFKSPGVSLYRSEIQKALQNGIWVSSGTNLFFANKSPKTRVIAVTGTKGKSTTSALLAHTLKKYKRTVLLGGNIGKPLIDFVDEAPDFVVAELSSYQCADLRGTPDIGILTNLFPEHLQWHQTHENYYRDKWHLIDRCHLVLLNYQDPRTQTFPAPKNTIWFNDPHHIHIKDDTFYDGQCPLLRTQRLPLIGHHNAENACAVLTALRALNFDIKKADFSDFKALPHRLQILGTKEGITYVDDSISTTPETAIAALKALPPQTPITLIAGGFDRGQDYRELAYFLSENKDLMRLVTLPDTGKRLADLAQTAGVQTSLTSDMPTAVNIAKHLTPTGGIILLSPAAPSYNLYKNFEARGLDFKVQAGF